MKIKLTSIPVDDVENAFTFYTEILGFVETMHVPEASLAIVSSAEEPDGPGLLLEPNDNAVVKAYKEEIYNKGLPVIIFSVDDIEQEYNRLTALGVVFRKAPTKMDYGMESIFEDTCGNLIQLIQL